MHLPRRRPPCPNAVLPGVTWCTCKLEEAETKDDDKTEARHDEEEDKAEVCYWAATARQWAADDKAEALRRKDETKARQDDEAKARREAAVTSWRRCNSHTHEELRRAYRVAKPKAAKLMGETNLRGETIKQGDDSHPSEEPSSPR